VTLCITKDKEKYIRDFHLFFPPDYFGHVFISGPVSSVGIATGYGLDGPGIESWRGRDFPSVQTGPGAHPASCTMGIGSFPGVKTCRGVKLTPHPLLVPWWRKSRAIPLLSLWAVRPVQSLSACTRVQFTYLPSRVYNVWSRNKFLPRCACVFIYFLRTKLSFGKGKILIGLF